MSPAPEDGFTNEGRQTSLVPGLFDRAGEETRVFEPGPFSISLERPAVVVGGWGNMDVLWAARASGAIELVGTDVDEPRGVSMVAPLQHQEVLMCGMSTGQTQGQFICLTPTAHEKADPEGIGKSRGKPLGILEYRVVQVSCVRVQQQILTVSRTYNCRMTVTHMGDSVHAIEVGPPLMVV